jgi:hypothetical protein
LPILGGKFQQFWNQDIVKFPTMIISSFKSMEIRPVAIRKILITALLMLVFPYPATAEPTLPSFTAEYRVKISVLSGRLRTPLTQSDEHYIAKSTVAARGLTHLFIHGQIQEEADFTISGDSIRPNHFGSAGHPRRQRFRYCDGFRLRECPGDWYPTWRSIRIADQRDCF